MPLRRMSFPAVAVLLMSVALPVPAQPFPSFDLDTTHVLGCASPTNCRLATGAFADSLGLVVWVDDYDRIRGTRVTHDLTVLDSLPLDIIGRTAGIYSAKVAASRTCFLVVSFQDSGYKATVVGRDGAVRTRMWLSLTPQELGYAVASDGEDFFVVWAEYRSSVIRLLSAAFPPGGGSVRFDTIMTAAPGDFLGNPCLAWGDSGYLVSWLYDSEAPRLCARFLRTGSHVVPDSGIVHVTSDGYHIAPALSFDGRRYFLNWFETKADSSRSDSLLLVARFSASGELIDTAPIVVVRRGYTHDIISLRDTTLVVWSAAGTGGSGNVQGRRLDGDGQLLDSISFPVASEWLNSVFRTDDHFVLLTTWLTDPLWHDPGTDVIGRRVTAGGQVMDSLGVVLSHSTSCQTETDVASDGANFLAVWVETRADPDITCRVWGRRFDHEGRMLDSAAFPISKPYHCLLECLVGYGDGCYLVEWLTKYLDVPWPEQVLGARVSREGVVLDSQPLVICDIGTRVSDADVAFGGGLFMTAFNVGGWLMVRRITSDGQMLDSAPIRIRVESGANVNPAIATDGNNFLIVILDAFTCNSWAIWLSPELVVIDTVLFRQHCPQFTFTSAYGAGIYLVSEDRYSYNWRFDKHATLLDSTPFQTPRGLRFGNYRSATFDGTNFLVAAVATDRMRAHTANGIGVTPEGELMSPDQIALSFFDSEYVMRNCALAADTLGNVALTFCAYEPAPYQSSRLRATTFPAIMSGIDAPRAIPALASMRLCPNPALDHTDLELELTGPEKITVEVFDAAGRQRTVAVEQPLAAGSHRIPLDLTSLASGVYFVRTRPSGAECKLIVSRQGRVHRGAQ